MSNASDFIIENGVLTKYVGPGGDVMIPEGVTKIGKYAFFEHGNSKCSTRIIIPKTVRSLDANWMEFGFENIESFDVDAANKQYCSVDGVLYNKNKTKLIRCPNKKTGSYRVLETVTTIEASAFEACLRLTDIQIPTSVSKIKPRAFFRCELSGIDVAKDSPCFCGIDGVLFNKDRSELIQFPQMKGGSYAIPNGVITIQTESFMGSKLVELTIPEGVETIGRRAFSYSEKLESVTLPGSISKLTYGATGEAQFSPFSYCKSIKNITLNAAYITPTIDKILGSNEIFGTIELNKLQAPMIAIDKIYSKYKRAAALGFINAYAGGFNAPTEISAAYTKYIFSQKKNILPQIFADDSVEFLKFYTDSGKITAKSFDDEFLKPAMAAQATQCVSLLLDYKNKHISSDLQKQTKKELSKDPFNAADMKKVFSYAKQPDGTIEITAYKGSGRSVEFPPQIGKVAVTKIADRALHKDFMSGSGMKSRPFKQQEVLEGIQTIIIPNGIKEIGRSAFEKCSGLKKVVLPNSLEIIGAEAFAGCNKLSEIEIEENNPNYYVENNMLIDRYWQKITHTWVKSNGGNSAERKPALIKCISAEENVVVPANVSAIEKLAFEGLKKLKSVVLSAGVTEIEDYAFSNCDHFEKITIPVTVTSIGTYALFFCSNVTIHAPAGSYAEGYAKKNNIPFVAEE